MKLKEGNREKENEIALLKNRLKEEKNLLNIDIEALKKRE